MLQFFYFVTSLVLFTVPFLIIPCTSFTCIHDEMTTTQKSFSFLSARSIKYKDYLEERTNDLSSYEPLQIHFYLDNIDPSVSSDVIYSIELAARKIKDRIAKTFQVFQRYKPFLLDRASCVQKWKIGKNRGKCSKVKNVKEVCSVKEIEFLIPSMFLKDLKVYDFEGDQPSSFFSAGSGLTDSNFIIFLTSQSASFCQGTDVSAYGTYCKSDSLTNEPLAGILNLCPEYFKSKKYPLKHYYNILLHEVFHILGFSRNLFEKFRPCRKGVPCYAPRPVIQQDSNGISRMMFPLVIEKMQKHFSCSNADFGGPVAMESSDNTTEKAISGVGSHWHPVLMYSSVMTPQFSEYDRMYIDSITLAVFGSTGWYHVNYSLADSFTFGKGQGCGFGMNDSCENKYLCNPSGNEVGCDLVHQTLGKCTSMTSDHSCGIYRPYGSEECVVEAEKQRGLDFYALGYTPKCFMVSNESSGGAPFCLPVKCKSKDNYEVMFNATWYSCKSEKVTVGNLTLQCPESYLFCKNSLTSVQRQLCPLDSFFVAVRLYFSLPTFKDLYSHQNFRNFKVTTLRAIAEEIKIPVNYIVNASLSVFKKVYLDFSICPPVSLERENLAEILSNTQKFLDGGGFVRILKGPVEKIISSTDLAIDPADAIAFSDNEGFRALVVFPVLCAIFLIATVVASVLRLFLIQRPQRMRIDRNIQLSDATPS